MYRVFTSRYITSGLGVARNTRLPLLVVVCREELLRERTEAMRVASSIKRGESVLFCYENRPATAANSTTVCLGWQ
jgi:hypothetical protein